MFLHMTLVDFSGGGEAGTQRMAGKQRPAPGFRQITAHPGRQRRPLDEAGHLLVVQSFWPDIFSFSGYAAEEGAFGKPGEFYPGLQRGDGAGGI